MNSARKEPSVPSVPEITIPNDIIQESGSPDSAFLSAGSSTDNQVCFLISNSKWYNISMRLDELFRAEVLKVSSVNDKILIHHKKIQLKIRKTHPHQAHPIPLDPSI